MNPILRNTFLRRNSNLISFVVGPETSSSFYIYNILQEFLESLKHETSSALMFDQYFTLPLYPSVSHISSIIPDKKLHLNVPVFLSCSASYKVRCKSNPNPTVKYISYYTYTQHSPRILVL